MIFASQRLTSRERQRQLLLDINWPSDLTEDELRLRIADLLELETTDEQIAAKLTASGIAPDRISGLIASGRAEVSDARHSMSRFDRTVGLAALLAGCAVVIVSWLTIDDAVLYLPGISAMVFGLVRLMRGREGGVTAR